jgi:hypothetical protein
MPSRPSPIIHVCLPLLRNPAGLDCLLPEISVIFSARPCSTNCKEYRIIWILTEQIKFSFIEKAFFDILGKKVD